MGAVREGPAGAHVLVEVGALVAVTLRVQIAVPRLAHDLPPLGRAGTGDHGDAPARNIAAWARTSGAGEPDQPRTTCSSCGVQTPSKGSGRTRTQSEWVTAGGSAQFAASTWNRPTRRVTGRLVQPRLASARRPTRPLPKVSSVASKDHADGSVPAEGHALARTRVPSRRTRIVQSVPAGTPSARATAGASCVTVSSTSFSTRSWTAPEVVKDSRAR